MSTRCQIGIYRTKPTDLTKYHALLYRHSDGYPEGVLPDITPFLETFHSQRGMSDVEYLAAWLIYHLIRPYDDANYGKYLGHGISTRFHGDIEYFYAISPGLVEVYECHYDGNPKHWTVVKDVKIAVAD